MVQVTYQIRNTQTNRTVVDRGDFDSMSHFANVMTAVPIGTMRVINVLDLGTGELAPASHGAKGTARANVLAR